MARSTPATSSEACVVRLYEYALPIPPSVNALWRVSGRRMHRSKKYTGWIDECLLMLELEQRPQIAGPFICEITVGRPRRKDGSISTRKADIDNRVKPVLDLLQHAGIVVDDANAWQVMVMWSNDIDYCQVRVWEMN